MEPQPQVETKPESESKSKDQPQPQSQPQPQPQPESQFEPLDGKEKEEIFISNFVESVATFGLYNQTPAVARIVDAAIFASPAVLSTLSYFGFIPPYLTHLFHADYLRHLWDNYEESLRQKKKEIVQEKLALVSLDHQDIVQYILVELAMDHFRSFELGFLNLNISHDNSKALTKAASDLAENFVTYLNYEKEKFPSDLYTPFVFVNDSGFKSFWRGARWLFGGHDFLSYDGKKVTEYNFYTKSVPVFRASDKLWARRSELEIVTKFLDGSAEVKKRQYNLQFIRRPFNDEANSFWMLTMEEIQEKFENVTEAIETKGIPLDYFGSGTDQKEVPSGQGQSGVQMIELQSNEKEVEALVIALSDEGELERRQLLKKLKTLIDQVLIDTNEQPHKVPLEVRTVILKSLRNEKIDKADIEGAIKSLEVTCQQIESENGGRGQEEGGFECELNEKEEQVHNHLIRLNEKKGTPYPDTAKKLKVVREQVAQHSKMWPGELAQKLGDHVVQKVESKKMSQEEIASGLKALQNVKEPSKFPTVSKVIRYALGMAADDPSRKVSRPDWVGGSTLTNEMIVEIRQVFEKLAALSNAEIVKGEEGVALEPLNENGTPVAPPGHCGFWSKLWPMIEGTVEGAVEEGIIEAETAGTLPL